VKVAYETVTFRIPKQLKKLAEHEADARGMTTTSFLCRAIENEVLRSEDVRAALDAKEHA
jgi:hypothetical protein